MFVGCRSGAFCRMLTDDWHHFAMVAIADKHKPAERVSLISVGPASSHHCVRVASKPTNAAYSCVKKWCLKRQSKASRWKLGRYHVLITLICMHLQISYLVARKGGFEGFSAFSFGFDGRFRLISFPSTEVAPTFHFLWSSLWWWQRCYDHDETNEDLIFPLPNCGQLLLTTFSCGGMQLPSTNPRFPS